MRKTTCESGLYLNSESIIYFYTCALSLHPKSWEKSLHPKSWESWGPWICYSGSIDTNDSGRNQIGHLVS